jgi:2-oxoisovalerate dehydrogenase E1 component
MGQISVGELLIRSLAAEGIELMCGIIDGAHIPMVVHTALVSRALDELEETRLVPARKVLYQFTSRGHDVTQVLLAQHLTGARDGIGSYYRSRPLLLALGLGIDEALASTMMRTGSLSEGRDVGVVQPAATQRPVRTAGLRSGRNTRHPSAGRRPCVIAQVLGDESVRGSIALVHGGEASTDQWPPGAPNIATTQKLPILFYIEDNRYGISVTSTCRRLAAT